MNADHFTLIGMEAETAYRKARAKHPPMRSPHEGYAILLEEVDELWAEVKEQKFDKEKAGKEALPVAAMAMAFASEVCDVA